MVNALELGSDLKFSDSWNKANIILYDIYSKLDIYNHKQNINGSETDRTRSLEMEGYATSGIWFLLGASSFTFWHNEAVDVRTHDLNFG